MYFKELDSEIGKDFPFSHLNDKIKTAKTNCCCPISSHKRGD